MGQAQRQTARRTTRRRGRRSGWWRLLPLALVLLVMGGSLAAASPSFTDWSRAGYGIYNLRWQPFEQQLGTATVANLQPKWVFTAGGDISATPAVADGAVYFPDWDGNFFKLDAETGQVIWSHRVSEYGGSPSSNSRTSPVVANGIVYIAQHRPANVLALDVATGKLLWRTNIERHPAVQLTASPIVFNNVLYIGTSSFEETFAGLPGYNCCTFRGSMLALDARTGAKLWQTYLAPDNGGVGGSYSGVPVWSSTPVVDPLRNSLYVTTGNNYSVPQSCIDDPSACAKDNYFDAIVALDLRTGAVKWSTGAEKLDAWNFACVEGKLLKVKTKNCPAADSPDWDFGAGANLITTVINGHLRQIVGAGQKSGVYWALDPDTGAVLWATPVGPPGIIGGIQWGTASDNQRIYVSITNSSHTPYQVNGQTVTGGSWSALDPATGAILWQTPDPLGGIDQAPVTVANGVVYGASADAEGHMYALDAVSGKILWSFASGGSVGGGAAIADGTVYWGSGYSVWPNFGMTGNDKFYAFSVPGAQIQAP
ncbi:MAG TPA: PQQ-binding-like beta-propeller repeat protein [Thermomicrobiaceae bacterium]|nr:PQQ-binding-like beta-propeller repeat protein [Thermomicrobiaceae bacterium]